MKTRKFEKITRIFVSRQVKRFGYSFLEAQFATPRVILTASHFLVANFKLGKKALNSSWKIELNKS